MKRLTLAQAYAEERAVQARAKEAAAAARAAERRRRDAATVARWAAEARLKNAQDAARADVSERRRQAVAEATPLTRGLSARIAAELREAGLADALPPDAEAMEPESLLSHVETWVSAQAEVAASLAAEEAAWAARAREWEEANPELAAQSTGSRIPA